MITYCDGRFVAEEEARVSPLAAGFQYGAGFFTTLKFRDGRFYFLDAHLRRLASSLRHYGLAPPEIDFEATLRRVVEANGLDAARLKIMAYEAGASRTGVVILAQELRVDKTPRRLALAPDRRGENAVYRHKAMSYFENIHLHRRAVAERWDDSILADTADRLLETCFCNLFLVKGVRALTPPTALPILPGVIRGELLRRGAEAGFEFAEAEVRVSEMPDFDAAFVTNSVHGVAPVARIGEIEYPVAPIEGLAQLDL